MEETIEKADESTERKYLALVSFISDMEKRLSWSELIFLALNIFIFCFSVIVIYPYRDILQPTVSSFDLMLILFCLIIGMAISTYWTAYASRLELNLKVKYFQLRYFERKMNRQGENIFSGLTPFFTPGIGKLESYDKEEILLFPKATLSHLDGFFGSIQPKHLSVFIPFLFFLFFVLIFWFIIILSLV